MRVRLMLTGVAVEKLQFLPKQPKFGGYKMSRKSKKSFVGHRRAILFWRISGEGVFQQPQALSQVCVFLFAKTARSISAMGIYRQPWAVTNFQSAYNANLMFNRYTEKARRAVFVARHEASQFGSPCVETEHLLLGLLGEDKALANRFLPFHASVESIRKQLEGRSTIRDASVKSLTSGLLRGTVL